MCSSSSWKTLVCQSRVEILVAAVVSMVSHLVATDESAPHKSFNAFLNSLSFLPSQELGEVIGICWQFSSLAVSGNISKYKVAFAVLGGWFVGFWFQCVWFLSL